MKYDAIIIGAGVVGCLTARELTRNGLKVCVVEKDPDVAMGATKANSAIVHAGFDAEPGTLKAKLNVEGSRLMPQVVKELGVKYINNGSLVVGFTPEDAEVIAKLYERGIENGVEGVEVIDAIRLKELEPNISTHATCALYAPTGAIVCPYDLAVAAMGNAMDNGAELMTDFEVTSIDYSGKIYRVNGKNESVSADIVINAAGIYSDKIAAMIGDTSFDVHPRYGEYILLDKSAGNLVKHTIFRTPTKMGKGILVSPTVDGNLLLGPTSVDSQDKEVKDTTPKGFENIIAQSGETVDGVHLNKTITSFCGLRAVGSTGDFIITSPKRGFVNLAGIESPGLSAAPAIAKYVAETLIACGYKLKEREDFNPLRENMHSFNAMTPEEKNEVIKSDPSYGRIICRCEGVTEGEILKAIRTNPKPNDLDGVKRRTRAQMGRCQGGFCMPYIIELIAKERGISMEEVTKSGGNSRVIVGKTKDMN